MRPFRALLIRRGHGQAWAYGLALLAYLTQAWLLVTRSGVEIGPSMLEMVLCLMPVAIAVAQLVYPTLLGWIGIVIPSVFFAGVDLFYFIRGATAWPPQWQNNVARFLIATAFFTVCMTLIRARPKSRVVARAT